MQDNNLKSSLSNATTVNDSSIGGSNTPSITPPAPSSVNLSSPQGGGTSPNPVGNINVGEPDPFVPNNSPIVPSPIATDPPKQNATMTDTVLAPSAVTVPQQTGSNTDPVGQVVTSSHVPKKYGGGKVIATIFGVLLITGAIVAGVTLVQNQQFRVGFAWDCSTYNFELSQSGNVRVLNGSTRNEPSQHAEVYINNTLINTFNVPALTPGTSADLGQVTVPSDNFSWRVKGTVDCEDSGSYGPQNTPTPFHESTPTPTLPPQVTATLTPTHEPTATLTPTLPPEVAAECAHVIAYDIDWNELDIQSLSQLNAGDTIYLTVFGIASSGTFDKARFTVNGVLRPETTSLKPGTTNVFYDEYEVPAGTTTFTVGAQVHHSELDWI